ncbi:DUF2384 domain-containing protein [Rhizobium ruizarguesonis]|uniref:DUF2384 domain-containing protein n=1 Tax=Rhizobium ruizarguesonis TaxID=2081791 RepID=A0ABY1WWC4_9HYPH|nr:antitoxin Xre/MbcA/ParS toxin-binding domain-containing protein [Rhizobium ruizarguesonis]TAU60887.1 DUF2384 domain-containing protein [Rhizobium ruizarguesonis]TAV19498.1 DUF2384 domain-containing protein [Rhizobium ruizarguesonis]TAV25498.1 DUF2384 domain-containing protein [Rhizobium ruizarguesonis]TAW82625.1 DUF2384 domain-containing protein [Rhizobium ruizarguesonis]TAX63373.1 DUF2384 domain-containing protein [Rhizobium ruizarguesonis]
MAGSHVQQGRARQAQVADRVAAKVADVLRADATFESGSVALSARIAGAAAAAIVDLPVSVRRELSKRQGELTRRIRGLVESFSDAPDGGKIALEIPKAVEPSKGEGLGKIATAEEGERLLDELAVARKLEDWAGPVAGANELQRDFGIARSTLNRWQHAGEVIALLKGTRKHVYPIEQFIDGRPAKGIGTIAALVSNQRVAWLWLSQPNPMLGGRRPINLLQQDHADEVVDAAQTDFSAQ